MAETFDFGDGLVPAHIHVNPYCSVVGWVANTAYVEPTVFVDRNARVFGNSQVYGNSQVLSNTQLHGNIRVNGVRLFLPNRSYNGNTILTSINI